MNSWARMLQNQTIYQICKINKIDTIYNINLFIASALLPVRASPLPVQLYIACAILYLYEVEDVDSLGVSVRDLSRAYTINHQIAPLTA